MAIGAKQAECLQLRLEHGGKWWPGCGWRYGNSSSDTLHVMRALERRGLVELKATLAHIEWHVREPERAFAAIAMAQARSGQGEEAGLKGRQGHWCIIIERWNETPAPEAHQPDGDLHPGTAAARYVASAASWSRVSMTSIFCIAGAPGLSPRDLVCQAQLLAEVIRGQYGKRAAG